MPLNFEEISIIMDILQTFIIREFSLGASADSLFFFITNFSFYHINPPLHTQKNSLKPTIIGKLCINSSVNLRKSESSIPPIMSYNLPLRVAFNFPLFIFTHQSYQLLLLKIEDKISSPELEI